ncbi:hypothetical protein LCGC14_1476670 [marine sediment metagenome]|uniref:Uncharacterized protein n=1 Tax=marine sediment metagenome TaxID=412755 RepID=A0A0F9JWS1_9ZZZZ
MADLEVPKSDYGYTINFGIKDANDAAYDLTDYVSTFKVWPPGNTAGTIVSGTCSILNVEAGGTVSYTVVNGNFDTAAKYMGEIELTKSGIVESTKKFSIAVVESA